MSEPSPETNVVGSALNASKANLGISARLFARILLLASLASLALSIVFALAPAHLTRTEISWHPSTGDNSGALQLSRGWPERITIVTTCERVRDLPAEVVFDSGGLLMYAQGTQVFLSIQGVDTPLSMSLPPDSCAIEGGFSSQDEEAFLSVDGQDQRLTLERPDFPAVARLFSGGSEVAAVDHVDITTRPTGIGGSGPRMVLALLALLLGVLVVALLVGTGERPISARRATSPVLQVVDFVVLLGNLTAALVIPVLLDDGWVLEGLDAYRQRGVFASLYDTNDAWTPQGFLQLYTLQALRGLGFDFVELRIAVALLTTLAWILLRRGVVQPAVGNSPALAWPPAAIFLAFSGAWLITLRTEPFVVLAVSITWVLLVGFFYSRDPLTLLAGTALTGAAVAIHQTGWTALGPWLVMIGLAILAVRKSKDYLIPYASAVLAGGAVAIVLLFIPFDLRTMLDSTVDFAAKLHNRSAFDEVERYSQLLTAYFSNAARFFSVLFILLILLVSALFYSSMPRLQKALWIASAISVASLTLTSSKWPWHFGVYAVPAAVLTGLVVAEISSKERRPLASPGFHVLLPATVLLAGMALSRSGNWGMIEGMPRGWEEFAATFGPDNHLLLWISGILLAILLGLFANSFGDRFSARATATIALAGLIVLPLMLSMAWIARNALETDGWSLVRQNLRAVANRDECGVLSDARFISSATPLPILAQRETSTALLTEGAFPSKTALAAGPLGEIPAWGSWTKDEGQGASSNPADPSSGTFTTPAFVVGGQDSIAVWTATEDPSTQSAEIVFEGADGAPTETVPLSLPVDLTWQLNLVAVPRGSSIAYFRVTDQSTASGGWTAVSSAASVIQQPAQEAFAGKAAFVGPFVKPAYPCLTLPIPIEGYWPRFDYVVSDNDLWNNLRFFQLGLTNIGCSTSYPTCVYKASYPMAEVTATTVS